MVFNRAIVRRVRSGSLESQILEDQSTLTSNGITFSQFTELTHRTSDVRLKKLRGYVYCRAGSIVNGDDERFRFALIKTPAGFGNPNANSFDDISQNIYEIDCVCNRDQILRWLY